MHVLHVIASGARRGGEIFASDLVRTLGERGVRQSIAVLHGPSPDALDLHAPVRVLSANGSARKLDPGIVASLRRVVRELHPEVIQAHGGEPLKYSSLAALGRPIVYRRIGAAVPEVRRGLRRALFAAQLRRAAVIVAVGEVVRRETVDVFGVPGAKVVSIPNAVDPGRLQPSSDPSAFRRSLGLPEDSQVITFVGAFTWEKDPLGNLEVALRVLEALPGAAFVMAGDGPLRGEVEAAARSHVCGDRVLLLGPRRDVPDILAVTDVLLAGSRTEGMPANLIEAGIAGVPVAAYGFSGIPEIVVDSETGTLVPPGDRDALRRAVSSLLADPAARSALGAAARARCLARFDVTGVASRYLDLYEEVTGARARSRA